jgi:hypothetical protein
MSGTTTVRRPMTVHRRGSWGAAVAKVFPRGLAAPARVRLACASQQYAPSAKHVDVARDVAEPGCVSDVVVVDRQLDQAEQHLQRDRDRTELVRHGRVHLG